MARRWLAEGEDATAYASMIDVTGDLWEYPADVRAITTNGFVRKDGTCVMGRGCAAQATERYPGIDLKLGRLIQEHGNRCFYMRFGWDPILAFPVKHHWREKADIALIKKSCGEAMEMADKWNWRTIVLPRPGCGNGGLDYYEDVLPEIALLLDDRFRVITYA